MAGQQKATTQTRYNDANTGQFVTEEYAKAHPKTTEKITIHRKPQK